MARRVDTQPAGQIAGCAPAGGCRKLLTLFASPVQPTIADYYEPWTYDYQTLVEAPLGDDFPVARPKSLLTGEDMKVKRSANWDDNLGGTTELGHLDPIVAKLRAESEEAISSALNRPSCSICPASASTA